MKYKFWGRVLWLKEPWQKAAQDLWHQLTAGKITATGLVEGGASPAIARMKTRL
jgi:hypothetical protein